MSNKKKTSKTKKQNSYELQQCGLPIVPIRELDSGLDSGRAFLIRHIEKKWVNNTVLHFYFFDTPSIWKGSPTQKDEVRKAFKKWTCV